MRRMSEERYPAGVPCWVEVLVPSPAAAGEFYSGLFGWELSESGGYVVASLDGSAVAGITALPEGGVPAWNTYVRVDSVADAAARVAGAGGKVALGPLDALPFGRLAVLIDPTGAVLSLWEPGERAGAELVNAPGTWMMSSLHTPDPAAANAFYGTLFGWQAAPFGPLTLYRLPDYVGGHPGQAIPRDVVAAMATTEGTPIPPHWNVNLRVADADAVAARAETLGGSVMQAPMDTPGFRSAVLADPQGAVFSVSQAVA
jgi:uncharacterized protein